MKQNISLIVYDFDGVMTDNRVLVFEDGVEAAYCNRSDGLAVGFFHEAGFKQIILSTEKNPIVKKRAEKLKLDVLHNIQDKKQTLLNYCEQNGHAISDVLYIGNDLNDLKVMQVVGYPLCPFDAYVEIKSISKLVFKSSGGQGVVRELFDLLSRKVYPFYS